MQHFPENTIVCVHKRIFRPNYPELHGRNLVFGIIDMDIGTALMRENPNKLMPIYIVRIGSLYEEVLACDLSLPPKG